MCPHRGKWQASGSKAELHCSPPLLSRFAENYTEEHQLVLQQQAVILQLEHQLLQQSPARPASTNTTRRLEELEQENAALKVWRGMHCKRSSRHHSSWAS